MSGAHHIGGLHHLHVPGSSPVHRMAPEAKLVGLATFVVVVALTPRQAVAAFVGDALILVGVVATARLSPRVVAPRLLVVAPFVLFAVLVPFIAGGEQTEVFGASLSVPGLWAAWNILVKALLGAGAAIVVSATTPIPEVLEGMSVLRVPPTLVGIVGSMVRYLDLIVDQFGRTREAMAARGHDPRWLWQVRPIASSVGTQFVRAYERGERVHLAMVARGFGGTMPAIAPIRAYPKTWAVALAPGGLAAAALGVAVLG